MQRTWHIFTRPTIQQQTSTRFDESQLRKAWKNLSGCCRMTDCRFGSICLKHICIAAAVKQGRRKVQNDESPSNLRMLRRAGCCRGLRLGSLNGDIIWEARQPSGLVPLHMRASLICREYSSDLAALPSAKGLFQGFTVRHWASPPCTYGVRPGLASCVHFESKSKNCGQHHPGVTHACLHLSMQL